MAVSVRLGMLALFAVLAIVLLARRIRKVKKYPSAPGPTLARFTDYWYLWKVWQGRFETWNIEQHALHGKVIRLGPNTYSIDDPTALKTIYGIQSNMPKGDWYRVWGDPRIPNHNLFSAQDMKFHGQMRRKLSNLFAMTSIKSYEPYVDDCVPLVFENFDRFAASGEVVNLQYWLQCYAFDVIGEITFGSRIGFLESGGQDIDGMLAKLDVGARFSTILGIDIRLAPILFAVLGNPLTGLVQFTTKMEEKQKAQSEDAKSSRGSAETFQQKLHALRKRSPEDYETYRMELAAVGNVGAGSDTTSIALTSTMFNLIKHPLTFLKLRDEINKAAARGKADNAITFDQAQDLPYLQYVIKEAMRVHASTGLPLWRVVQDPGVTLSGVFFPAGAIVGVNTWVAHYNSTVFGPDASDFRPERWDPANTAPEKLAEMERYFLPFGAGTRTCIGKNISILEMSKLVPQLVRRYNFELLSNELEYENNWFVKQRNVNVRISQV